jgi:hypothetical protein
MIHTGSYSRRDKAQEEKRKQYGRAFKHEERCYAMAESDE